MWPRTQQSPDGSFRELVTALIDHQHNPPSDNKKKQLIPLQTLTTTAESHQSSTSVPVILIGLCPSMLLCQCLVNLTQLPLLNKSDLGLLSQVI